ncbi:hypothetical protein RJI07_09120 [Mycoplasmatota bacterium WC30]
MRDLVKNPSDLIAWIYDNLPKRTSSFPKGQYYLKYHSEIKKLAKEFSKIGVGFTNFKNAFFNNYNLEYFEGKMKEDFLLASLHVVSNRYKQKYNLTILEIPTIKINKTLNPLNTLYKNKYLVYPKFEQTFVDIINQLIEGELRKRSFKNPINEDLNNYVIVKNSELKDFKYRVISYNDMRYIKNLTSDKKIQFTFVPFIKEKFREYFEVDENLKTGDFSVIGPLNEEKNSELLERYKKTLYEVYNSGVYPEFVIFPEMILTDDIVYNLPKIIEGLDLKKSSLILAGTHWKDNKNTAYLYNHKGSLIASQNKYFAFDYKTKAGYKMVERINNSNDDHILNILDIEGIGRIAIFICKDLKSDEYLNLLRLVNVDMVFAPSYSESNDVLSEVNNLAENYLCTTVFLNACSSGKKDIGRIVLPNKTTELPNSKEKTVRSSETRKIERKDCRDCTSFCEGIDFTLDLKEIFNSK